MTYAWVQDPIDNGGSARLVLPHGVPFNSVEGAVEFKAGDPDRLNAEWWLAEVRLSPVSKDRVTAAATVESPSGWQYRVEQENGDNVDCWSCGDPLDDNYPIANNEENFAYHRDCVEFQCAACGQVLEDACDGHNTLIHITEQDHEPDPVVLA